MPNGSDRKSCHSDHHLSEIDTHRRHRAPPQLGRTNGERRGIRCPPLRVGFDAESSVICRRNSENRVSHEVANRACLIGYHR
jgi:hypothetical protein